MNLRKFIDIHRKKILIYLIEIGATKNYTISTLEMLSAKAWLLQELEDALDNKHIKSLEDPEECAIL